MVSFADIRNIVAELTKPLKNRIFLMLARGVINNSNDDGVLQTHDLDLLAGEQRSDVETLQHYGIDYRPPDGSEALAVFLTGNRDNGMVIATKHRESRESVRPNALEKGELIIYTDEGDYVYFKRNREIIVNCGNKLTANVTNDVEVNTARVTVNASESVEVNTPDYTVNGENFIVNASTGFTMNTPQGTASGAFSINGVEHSTHVHEQGNDSDGDSEVPTDGPKDP